MYQRIRELVLRWLKVPPEPHPPAGDPSSLRVFRAGKNYFKLRLLGWAVPQLFALAGIIFWTVVLLQVENAVRAQPAGRAPAPAMTPESLVETIKATTTTRPNPDGKAVRKKIRPGGWAEFQKLLVQIATQLPPWSFPLIWIFKIGAILLYLAQIPFSFAMRRLDYELRWYVVTDRSLRIRTGLWQVQELTMSFANLQQVVVTQGPVQRFLGLADVRVQSAGGGGDHHAKGSGGDTLHTAMFHCVDNATEIRDLILARLRQFRAAGLGDPDDHPKGSTAEALPATAAGGDALAAARELLAETQALRRAL